MCGGDAALCHITLTACSHFIPVLFAFIVLGFIFAGTKPKGVMHLLLASKPFIHTEP